MRVFFFGGGEFPVPTNFLEKSSITVLNRIELCFKQQNFKLKTLSEMKTVL